MSNINADNKSINNQYFEYLQASYPELNISSLSDRMICASPITLPADVIEQMKAELKVYHALRMWGQKNLKDHYSTYGLRSPNHFGVCDSFDFHIDANGQPKLIEINTNAAFFAMGVELYRFFEEKKGVLNSFKFEAKNLVEMFREEIGLSGANQDIIYIIDEKPTEQRLYVEFELYRAIFRKFGIECLIVDATDSAEIEKIPKNSFIYNRHTDFYLSDAKSNLLRQRFNNGELHLSPHPWEYFLMADKQRFLEWNAQKEIPLPASLLKTFDVDIESLEQMWEARKNLFFKPKSSFGSKGVFKGASISRKTFEGFRGQGFIGQHVVPAPEVELDVEIIVDNNVVIQKQKMKYDLRCYAYQDQLQLIIARVYQGQTTNLRTEGGGFAIVQVS